MGSIWKYAYCLIFMLLCSCSNGIVNGEKAKYEFSFADAVEVVKADIFKDKVFSESHFEEISEDVQFSGINKILVLPDRNELLTLDALGHIDCISYDGQKGSVNINKGRARNEYVSAADIAVNTSSIIILENNKLKLFPLRDNFGSIASVDLAVRDPVDAVAPCGEEHFYVFSAFSSRHRGNERQKDSLLFIVEQNGSLVRSFSRRKDCTFSLFNISQSKPGKYHLRPQDNNFVFFSLDEDGLVADYKLDFGEKAIPERFFFEEADGDIFKYLTSDYFKLPMECHEAGDYAAFRVAGPNASEVSLIFNSKNGKGLYWINKGSEVDLRILGSTGESFICIVSIPERSDSLGPFAEYVMNEAERQQLDKSKDYLLFLTPSFL